MTKEGDIGVDIAVAIDEPAWQRTLPNFEDCCRRAASAALAGRVTDGSCEISVLLTNDAHMARLNEQFRQRASSTNVLSFPADAAVVPGGETRVLGDVVLAYETVAAEASAHGKAIADHVAHLMLHGVLHLLGLDHQSDAEAEHMEALETEILKGLGIADPYEAREMAGE